jgi:hypothetical protein
MAQLWEVVGGTASGGILVREGKELSSAKMPERLSTGALVRELALEGERLHFQRLTGSGPETGWVGIVLSGKSLVVKTDKTPPVAPEPASNGGGYTNGAAPAMAFSEKNVKEEQSAKEVAPTIDKALKELHVAATATETVSVIAAAADTCSAQNVTEDALAPIDVTIESDVEMPANKAEEVRTTELPADSTVEADKEEVASIGDAMVPVLTIDSMKTEYIQNEEVRQAWRPGQGRFRRHLRNATCFGRGR